ncbi:MAG TPA: GIY-YIG nuclease family protein [Aliidongia sp.]|uniref:GIY-YIG nuclease family protein n=1 Tax=Aliidongia sp. TaxID=1914230 RepID=UPI002DDDA903|nr:GIY-YIG nuclease family protein [Aliidongia sp.]HEV2674925.1 GIY-YIG nuclease family protein [Aliidongia sp.]
MNGTDRKAAIAAYKERRVVAGIYVVRCIASGERWVGRAPDLDTIRNRLWFTLRQNLNLSPSLQAAWNARGVDQFAFEELERLPHEELPYVREAAAKRRLAHWRAALGATVI